MSIKRIVALSLLLLSTLVLTPGSVNASAWVQPLWLPVGATIKPEGTRVLMLSRGNVTAATITVGKLEVQRVAVWRHAKVEMVDVVTRFETGMGPSSQAVGALTTDGTLFVNAGYPFSGAYSGTNYHIFAFKGRSEHEVESFGCDLAGDAGEPIVEAANGDDLAVTFQSPNLINLDNVDSGLYAPNAAIARARGCDVIGRADIRAIKGRYAAGFRAYIGKNLAPTNFDPDHQRYVAVRWAGRRPSELGEGVALDVNARGVCVGATAPPGVERGYTAVEYGLAIPQAVIWQRDGSATVLKSYYRSVAYAVDDDARVVGMLQDPYGKHYAFIWRHGAVRRLDDLVQAPRWRFESAYGFTGDGGILGIGTHDGVATAFIVHL